MIQSKGNSAPVKVAPDTLADLGFSVIRKAFARAREMHPQLLCKSTYTLAGRLVKMRIIGRELAEIMDLPFAHLVAKLTHVSVPSLTIELWDEAETGIPCQIGSNRQDLDLHPILKKSHDGRYATYQLQHSFVALDRRVGVIIGFISNADDLSLYERGRPLHVPLSLWHKSLEMPVVHAGLISKNSRGVLLAGSGGSGKSTSAISSACAGFSFLSDDLIGLQPISDEVFLGHSLYSSTFMEPEHLERFPLLAPNAIKGKYAFEKKHLVLLSKIRSLRFEQFSRIQAVALPRVFEGHRTRFRPASKGEALLALAPSSLLVGERSFGREGFKKLADLVEKVPCYWLELGKALNEIPLTIEELLAETTP